MGNLVAIMNFLIFGLGAQELLIIGFIVLIPAILFLWALVDVLSSEFSEKNNKFIWIAVILFLPVLGPLLYFMLGKNQKTLAKDQRHA
jgi:hypothetical protein